MGGRIGGATGLAAAALLALAPVSARAADMAPWPDTFVARLEALALIQSLNAAILGSRSATFSLEKWCGDHGLAEPARIVARLDPGMDKPSSAEQRQRLQVGTTETVKYRHVRLLCGDRVLSEADNWYVPGRLTDEMNRLLETTDTPFGKAVKALHPFRQTFAATTLWSPLPEGWEQGPVAAGDSTRPLVIPDSLFEHRAVLFTNGNLPFSEVDEVYKRALLDFTVARP